MNRRDFLAVTGTVGLSVALPRVALAQQAKLPRIAYLTLPATPTNIQAFLDGLADNGYVDGRNIIVEQFVAQTAADLPTTAAKAVAGRPDIIVARAGGPALAAKAATRDIPIVFAGSPDPVALGLVSNMAHPTENLTGTSIVGPLLAGKAFEIMRELLPRLSRVAVFQTTANAETAVLREQAAAAADALRIELLVVDVKNIGEDQAQYFAGATGWKAEAVFVWAGLLNNNNGAALNSLAVKNGLPTFATNATNPDQGGLLSYGAEVLALIRRGAFYVDQILKGAKPADLAVEQPTVVEFVINLRTAKALGIVVPPSMLFRADRVIDA